MSSAICQNFVQNAWKKELCSNCFKSKDEHADRPRPKPIALVSNEKVEGIIRNGAKSGPKRSVCFPKELAEIIGYGGEDWDSEGEEKEDDGESSDEDFEAESEEEEGENELKRITKENTDFNTTGLKEENGVKKQSLGPLQLGKPVVDSAGRKQTLLVSVTPFGEEPSQGSKRFIKGISHIPISKAVNRENVPETKTSVVLTSYTKNEEDAKKEREEKSLLDEITETLENSKNPIQIMSRKKVQKEIVLTMSKTEEPPQEPIKSNLPERKVALSRTPALKRDQEKPVIYQTSTAKIELLNSKNVREPVEVPPPPIITQNREQPDGRADPETVVEPPALPLTPPPPLETQNTFLHNSPIYEKPKIPAKPAVVLRKPPVIETKNVVLTTFVGEIEKIPLTKQDSNGSDVAMKGKRRAPKPPEEIYARPPSLLREKEKRVSEEIGEGIWKMRSVSTDSLCEDKAKSKSKGRFSLKKFLRMGSNKDLAKEGSDNDAHPVPKPRLVIVHPSELNGSRVEVVENLSLQRYSDYESFTHKPPPPPRNLDNKPSVPHPPKSAELINKQKQEVAAPNHPKKTETVYANIGEVRSAMVPNKPQRTASMREREAQQQKQERKNNYAGEENVYDYINSGRSSSPDSDSSPNKNSPTAKIARLNKRSESSIDISGDYYKFGNIPRSMSLTYCGSETESEIYSPYSFYGSESEVNEDDHEWIQNGRTHKLRSRKGRSIVHKNLEDNYGAVIVANHEALAQVLENIQQTSYIQPALRGLKLLPNLRWTDFSIKPTPQPLTVGSRTFHHALWNNQHVTLVINTETVPCSTLSLGNCSLTPVTEFSDLVPEEQKQIQATVGVLPWLQVSTIQSYSDSLKTKTSEDTWKDSTFLMLQLVNALKILQAQGIEEVSLSLNNFVLCKEMDKDTHQRLCVLQGFTVDESDSYGTLCMCASKALALLQPNPKITSLLQSLLNNERAVTLTQVKSVLEFCLWGPSDVALGSTVRDREQALQRWLDLQRATVLHGLVCARVQLTVYEECHLFFLVRSNSRMMCDASLLLESSTLKNGFKSAGVC